MKNSLVLTLVQPGRAAFPTLVPNHLKDVHELHYINRKKWSQEAKLQRNRSQRLKRSSSKTPLSVQNGKKNSQRKKKHERRCQRSHFLPKTTLEYLVELGREKRFGSRHPLVFWSWAHLVVVRLVLPSRYSWIIWKNCL